MGSFQIQIQRQLLYCFLPAAIIVCLIIHFGGQVVSAIPIFSNTYKCEGDYFTNGSRFQRNLDDLLSSLSPHVADNKKFYYNSIGEYPDIVYGILLCRGDVSNEDCKICAASAVQQAIKRCSNWKPYISWYNNCMLRYSNQSIFSIMAHEPEITLHSKENVTDQGGFNDIVTQLMDGLVRLASTPTTTATTVTALHGDDMFATGEFDLTSDKKIYGLVQCTPDITARDCNRCLAGAVYEIPRCCFGKQGGIVLRPSCFIRYELYSFYKSKPATTAVPPPSPSNATITGEKEKIQKKHSNIVLFHVGIPLIIASILLTACIVYVCLRKKKKGYEMFDGTDKKNSEMFHGIHLIDPTFPLTAEMDDITRIESLQCFELGTIRAATDNFSNSNKLGKGGFGFVYNGRLLPDGQEIAVKSLSINSEQGKKEFKTEVGLLFKLQHRNLVKILGFCLGEEEKLLVYEYVPNGSLDRHIFDPLKAANLNWETRYNIIGGIAKGLLYLHEDSRLRIIHRDLKPSNVLLDEGMNAKISDFGMAKLFEMDETRCESSKIVGTYGYIAPEYASHGQFSAKSDVYSFGVLVLEIITGKKINTFFEAERSEYLVNYVWRHWEEGRALELIDQTIRDCFVENEVMRSIQIGLLSVQDVTERPSMASIVKMLTSDTMTPQVLSPPAVFHRGNQNQLDMIKEDQTSSTTAKSSENSIQLTHRGNSSNYWTVNDVTSTEVHPR